jgi:hypothetical protein
MKQVFFEISSKTCLFHSDVAIANYDKSVIIINELRAISLRWDEKCVPQDK